MIPRQSIESIYWVLAVLLIVNGMSIVDAFAGRNLDDLLNIMGFFLLLWCFCSFHRLRQIRRAADASAAQMPSSASQPGH
jgi:hypothetical protein